MQSYMDPNLFTQADAPYHHTDYGMQQPLQPHGLQMPAQQGNYKTININTDAFIRTRDAVGLPSTPPSKNAILTRASQLASAYMTLSSSIDRAVKAYIEHTNNVLHGDATLDISHLTRPFDQLANTAQIARDALQQHPDFNQLQLNGGGPAPTQLKDEGVDEKGKRKKRPYKPRDPNAPKRPQTAYFRFLGEQRPLLGKTLADRAGGKPQKPGDLSREATARWNAMSKEEQQPYREAYQRELKEYDKKAAKYRAEGGVLTEKDMRILAALEKEDADALAAAEDDQEDDDEDDDEEEAADAKPAAAPAAAADEDDDEDDDDSDDDEDEDEKEPTPPPPPQPTKTPKSALKKSKQQQAATPSFSSLNAPAAAAPTAASTSPERKRKAPASSDAPAAAAEEPAKKKRGRKSNAEKAAAEAVPPTPAAPVAQMSSDVAAGGETGKKKKKRKSAVAGAD